MAEETEGQESGASTTGKSTDPAAAGLALGGASREEADVYLREQTRLSRLQSQYLVEQNAFELSHLKWRRFNDQMKGAMQILLVAIGAVFVAAIAAAIWSAAH